MNLILVTCALIFSGEKVLCAQRSEKMNLPGFWEFPGGKIEEGETAESCLIREIEEELAISITLVSSLQPNEHAYSDEKVVRLLPFVCSWKSGELILREHQEVRFLPKERLKSLNWAPADIPIVDELLANWDQVQKQLVDYKKR
ncbi:(deoxy)nucleoside triphosphate pyrophosphohydrolase [Algoriphagus sp.]|uniref:(deoxy)nucleoside triphosphate pyrophosphohydrolase n=1 Tax=Algoriphagus sp. TaxID=1872435 RepID=UPI0032722822